MRKQQQAAIEALAGHFSATWHKGEEPPDAYLRIARKRIGVEVTTLPANRTGVISKPRLRFDKVALGLVRRLQTGLNESLPDGKTVVFTVTAPILQPSKTAAALEARIRTLLKGRPARAELTDTIHGNRIRVRVMKDGTGRASRLIGFVHNPDSDPASLFDVTRSLLACIGAELATRAPARFAGERWLVIADEDGLAPVDTYRQVYSQLSIPTGFRQVLMVLAGRRVASLTP